MKILDFWPKARQKLPITLYYRKLRKPAWNGLMSPILALSTGFSAVGLDRRSWRLRGGFVRSGGPMHLPTSTTAGLRGLGSPSQSLQITKGFLCVKFFKIQRMAWPLKFLKPKSLFHLSATTNYKGLGFGWKFFKITKAKGSADFLNWKIKRVLCGVLVIFAEWCYAPVLS